MLNFTGKNSKVEFCVIQWYLVDIVVTYTVRLWLVGKRVVDFLLVLIEHFSLAVTVETL